MKHYVHSKTGERYSSAEYGNYGPDHIPPGRKDLPADGYPYTVVSDPPAKAAWDR